MKYHTQVTRENRGFTLVELSIVVVIIGLIVAGVVAGQKLVEQAKLRQVITDMRAYEVAFNGFKVQYDALPGDMTNAATYWSACTDSGGNTCNGDGDGSVEYATGSDYEGMRFWQHLSQSGFVSGSFTGTDAIGDGNQFNPGVNAPEGPFDDDCYFADNLPSSWGATASAAVVHGSTETNLACSNGSLTVQQVQSIEAKIDDELPDSGKVQTVDGNDAGTNCVSGGAYQLANSGNLCQMAYVMKR